MTSVEGKETILIPCSEKCWKYNGECLCIGFQPRQRAKVLD